MADPGSNAEVVWIVVHGEPELQVEVADSVVADPCGFVGPCAYAWKPRSVSEVPQVAVPVMQYVLFSHTLS